MLISRKEKKKKVKVIASEKENLNEFSSFSLLSHCEWDIFVFPKGRSVMRG
jgi:hypothetical protein